MRTICAIFAVSPLQHLAAFSGQRLERLSNYLSASLDIVRIKKWTGTLPDYVAARFSGHASAGCRRYDTTPAFRMKPQDIVADIDRLDNILFFEVLSNGENQGCRQCPGSTT